MQPLTAVGSTLGPRFGRTALELRRCAVGVGLAWTRVPVSQGGQHRAWGSHTVTGPWFGTQIGFWGSKTYFFHLLQKKPKYRTRHRFWSPESHPNCYWRQVGSFVDTPWRRHSRVHPCSARALWGIILKTAKVSEKLCFHSQKTSHFEKQWWPPVLTTPSAFPHTMLLKQTAHRFRLLPSVCAVLCMDVQLTASSWGPSL